MPNAVRKVESRKRRDDDVTGIHNQTSAKTIACAVCGQLFTPRRSTARFCSPKCRQRAHRRVSLAPVDELKNAKCNVSLTRNSCASTAGLSQPSLSLPRTAAPPQVLASNSTSVALHIVPDQNWLSMWRIALPDGRSSGMLNLTRAKDVLRSAKRFSRHS